MVNKLTFPSYLVVYMPYPGVSLCSCSGVLQVDGTNCSYVCPGITIPCEPDPHAANLHNLALFRNSGPYQESHLPTQCQVCFPSNVIHVIARTERKRHGFQSDGIWISGVSPKPSLLIIIICMRESSCSLENGSELTSQIIRSTADPDFYQDKAKPSMYHPTAYIQPCSTHRTHSSAVSLYPK
jgi:hypothetical protein